MENGPEQQLKRLAHAHKALVHRERHYRNELQDLNSKLVGTRQKTAGYLEVVDATGKPVFWIENIPQNIEFRRLYQIAILGLSRVEREIKKNETAQRNVKREDVKPVTTPVSQIPQNRIPAKISLSMFNSIDNPYYEFTSDRYAGPPEGYQWDASAGLEYFELKRLLARYNMKIDTVYASSDSVTRRFAAVGERGSIVWYRRPGKERSTRLSILGMVFKGDHLITRKTAGMRNALKTLKDRAK